LAGATYTDNSDDELRRAAEADGLEFAGGGTALPALNPGSYLVALIATSADRVNYHWLRMHADGTWSHKPGNGTVQGSDADGNALNHGNPPHAANFYFRAFFESSPKRMLLMATAEQQGWALNYDRFVGYFYCPNIGLQAREKKGCCIMQ